MARISGIVAEPLVTLPAAEAVGRLSAVVAEAIVTVPAADKVARLSGVVAEAAVTEAAAEMRVGFVFAEVFGTPPSVTPERRPSLDLQGARISTQG